MRSHLQDVAHSIVENFLGTLNHSILRFGGYPFMGSAEKRNTCIRPCNGLGTCPKEYLETASSETSIPPLVMHLGHELSIGLIVLDA
ncbi:hypothetical protein BGX21_006095, partial [Mortierella sp. AD011]